MKTPSNLIKLFFYVLALTLQLQYNASALISNSVKENEKEFGDHLSSIQYSEDSSRFSGKRVYNLPFFGWNVEVLYVDGKSISEVARPRGGKVKKQILTEQEANVIADMLFKKKDRGPYRKQVKNANFISHFFEEGVVSYEMKLDDRRKDYVGIIGVRTILYSNGNGFNDIKINAYH